MCAPLAYQTHARIHTHLKTCVTAHAPESGFAIYIEAIIYLGYLGPHHLDYLGTHQWVGRGPLLTLGQVATFQSSIQHLSYCPNV